MEEEVAVPVDIFVLEDVKLGVSLNVGVLVIVLVDVGGGEIELEEVIVCDDETVPVELGVLV